MAKTSIYFKGLDVLKKGLNERATLSDVKKTVMQNGVEMTAQAKRNAPVRTGDLRGSITQSVTDGGLTTTTAPNVHYAAYVEHGTRYMEAQPYLKPAHNVQKDKFMRDLRRLTK